MSGPKTPAPAATSGFFAGIENFFVSDVWAGMKVFFTDEAAALTPIAEDAATTLTEEETTALVTGNTASAGAILSKLVSTTATKALAAGVSAAPTAIIGAVGTVVAKIQANAPAPVAAPPNPAAPPASA